LHHVDPHNGRDMAFNSALRLVRKQTGEGLLNTV
jgi:hypothetical protein